MSLVRKRSLSKKTTSKSLPRRMASLTMVGLLPAPRRTSPTEPSTTTSWPTMLARRRAVSQRVSAM